MQIIIFQVLYTLIQIKKIFPTFIHNDLNPSNILVQIDNNYNENIDKYYIYHFENQYYLIPVLPFQIKLWDFGLSQITGIIDNIEEIQDSTDLINIIYFIYKRFELLNINNSFTSFILDINNKLNDDEDININDLLFNYNILNLFAIDYKNIKNYNVINIFGI